MRLSDRMVEDNSYLDSCSSLYYSCIDNNLNQNQTETIRREVKLTLQNTLHYLSKAKVAREHNKLKINWRRAEGQSDSNGVWIELIKIKGERAVNTNKAIREFLNADYIEDGHFKIKILGANPDKFLLLLETEPLYSPIFLKPKAKDIERQWNAVFSLCYMPHPAHRSLIRLLENKNNITAKWPNVKTVQLDPSDWEILRPDKEKGFTEDSIKLQRQFVETALSVEDFAILEGPPGTGKTTAISEYVLQEIKRGKKVLLCASTNVAVDNVLYRLKNYKDVIGIRIGSNREKILEEVKDLFYDTYKENEKIRIISSLEKIENRSESQQYLLNALRSENDETITDLIMDCANLVCGTTSGILRHPEISRRQLNPEPIYDVLVIDEASKTTYQDFIIPALYAKKWIISGDPMQLSPFADKIDLAANIKDTLDLKVRQVCIDVFNCLYLKSSLLVIEDNKDIQNLYKTQAEAFGLITYILNHESKSDIELLSANVVIGSKEDVSKNLDYLPLDIGVVRGEIIDTNFKRRLQYWSNRKHITIIDGIKSKNVKWEEEVAWRLDRSYQLRKVNKHTPEEEKRNWYEKQIKQLMPRIPEKDTTSLSQIIRLISITAFPSIIESLESGINEKLDINSVLVRGFDGKDLRDRCVQLCIQYRMHSNISKLARDLIYQNKPFEGASNIDIKREWKYNNYNKRAFWLMVKGNKDISHNYNESEVKVVLKELKKFIEWVEPDGLEPEKCPIDRKHWEVAILTFYLDQEDKIRSELDKSDLFNDHTKFDYWSKKKNVHLTLGTVDRFQGQEADIVFLSFVQNTGIGFLDSPDRLNVALTRGRYQLVLIGNQHYFLEQEDSKLLQDFAKKFKKDRDILIVK